MKNFILLFALLVTQMCDVVFAQVVEGTSARQLVVRRNFIKDGNAEAYTRGFVTYNDGSVQVPVDGVGGTPTVSAVAVSTTSPLEGKKSFVISKPASNVQGQGYSIPFSIDNKDRGKSLEIDLNYELVSGTFVSSSSPSTPSDLTLYIYDVTNSTLITPSTVNIPTAFAGNKDNVKFSWQSPTNSTSFRLIMHHATTSASAFVLRYELSVNPSLYVNGTPATSTIPCTATSTWVTNTAITCQYSRLGDKVFGKVRVSTSGAPTATELRVTLPWAIDSSKIPSATEEARVGYGTIRDSGTASYTDVNVASNIGLVGNTTFIIQTGGINAFTGAQYVRALSGVTSTVPITFGAGDYIEFEFSYPVIGWSSSVQMSDTADTRVVAVRALRSTTLTVPASTGTAIPFTTVVKDTHGAYNPSTGVFTAPVTGTYQVKATVSYQAAAWTSGNVHYMYLTKNPGSISGGVFGWNTIGSTATVIMSSSGGTSIDMNAGDTLTLFAFHNNATSKTIEANGDLNHISIERVSGPSAIAATEEVSARYVRSTAFTITTTEQVLPFPTRETDTHLAYNGTTGEYTVPANGTYQIAAQTITQGSQIGTYGIRIYKNGVNVKGSTVYSSTSANLTLRVASVNLPLKAGDVISVRILLAIGTGNASIEMGIASNSFEIIRASR